MPVEPRRRDRGDEELRTVGAVRLAVATATQAGVRHGQQVRAVEDQIGDDLIIELVARAAGAVADRAAALDHEILDDAVEGQPVVERVMLLLAGERVAPRLLAGGETEEVRHGVRSLVVEKIEGDIALGGMHDNCGHTSIVS